MLVKLLFFGSLALVLVGLIMGIRVFIKNIVTKKKAKKWQDAT
jgi:hypothetical protein